MLELESLVDEEATKIIQNQIWLCKEKILSKTDIESITRINTELGAYRILCYTGHLITDNIMCVNKDLNDALIEIRELSPLTSIKYSYDMRLSRNVTSLEKFDF